MTRLLHLITFALVMLGASDIGARSKEISCAEYASQEERLQRLWSKEQNMYHGDFFNYGKKEYCAAMVANAISYHYIQKLISSGCFGAYTGTADYASVSLYVLVFFLLCIVVFLLEVLIRWKKI